MHRSPKLGKSTHLRCLSWLLALQLGSCVKGLEGCLGSFHSLKIPSSILRCLRRVLEEAMLGVSLRGIKYFCRKLLEIVGADAHFPTHVFNSGSGWLLGAWTMSHPILAFHNHKRNLKPDNPLGKPL